MERRAFIAAAAATAVLASSKGAGAASHADMHPAKYKALQDDCGHCVATANDCLRHCIGMLAMKDDSMAACMDTTYQVIAACNALQTLAALNSPHVAAFAKATADICDSCRNECDKFPNVAACKACGQSCKSCATECRKV